MTWLRSVGLGGFDNGPTRLTGASGWRFAGVGVPLWGRPTRVGRRLRRLLEFTMAWIDEGHDMDWACIKLPGGHFRRPFRSGYEPLPGPGCEIF